MFRQLSSMSLYEDRKVRSTVSHGRAGLIYVALFLDAASRSRVCQQISMTFPNRPVYDHVTLKYGISVEEYQAHVSSKLGSMAHFLVRDVRNRVMSPSCSCP